MDIDEADSTLLAMERTLFRSLKHMDAAVAANNNQHFQHVAAITAS
jgi:hypothetical protein